ncbi:MAG TPA: outer membrane protein assembly factor BamA [Gammaproteobacteria bacterium]|nr:outer membrane protein assembly factor BamA [Gammaproteobacteria bacterium]
MGLIKGTGIILASLLFLVLSSAIARADEPFTVKKIEIVGLQRISEGTVYDYLPINIGDNLTEGRIQDAIRALYKTGFFRDVEMRRDKDTLIIIVHERPSIAKFVVSGNKLIKSDDLYKNLNKAGLSQGQIFNRVTLDGFIQQLTDEYYSHGKYAAIITPTITDIGDNRVNVSVKISEGVTAKIRSISIIGNHAFSDDDLRDIFKLKVADFWTFFGSSDEYSREKLVGDLESLRSYYMDRGYADFAIDSTQVAISPDRNNVYITVNITEGDIYKIKDVKLAGQFVLPKSALQQFVLVKPGEIFSLKRATTTADIIQKRLGMIGFGFAQVNPIPDIDRQNKLVSITFYIEPGQRVYVRHVNFNEAPGTDDAVFRREMRQFEGTWLSNIDVERSRVRLNRLPWMEDVKVKTVRVPGSASLVDVDYTMKERPAGTASVGVGYGSYSGLVLDGNIVNANFLGSGERLSIQANQSYIGHQYNISFTNPYWTVDGISRTLAVFQSQTSALTINSAPLTTQSYGGQMSFNIPLTEYSAWGIGGTYSHNELFSQQGSSHQYIAFISNPSNGQTLQTLGYCADSRGFSFVCQYPALRFNTLELSLSYVRDTRDRIIFPNNGARESLSLTAAIPGFDQEYYILSYQQLMFIPLFKGFIYGINGEADYGAPYGKTATFPPYKNFFDGGPDTVRGWRIGTLGPLDSSGYPSGGRAQVYMQNELILPSFGKKTDTDTSSSRWALFIDAGNAFTDPGDFRWSNLRISTGLAATFLTPLGAMKFSYALPLNAKPGDQTERFQFTLGTYF